MKKIRYMLFILGFILLMMPTSFAGDMPEALGYEDTAQVFIGTLCDFKKLDENNFTNVEVIPTFKIKGDVEIDEIKTYSQCYFGSVVPQKEKEYLFGWFSDDSVYAYEIESYNDEKIKIKTTDAFAERIQNYLDEGYYENLEEERVNVGRKITFTEFLDITEDLAETVTINFNGNQYEADKEKFFKISDDIIITDVKNSFIQYKDGESFFNDMLFITVTKNQADENTHPAYAAVSKLGEVDRYSLTMSRLPSCDFQMEKKDIQKLYELLPDAVQDAAIASNTSHGGVDSSQNIKVDTKITLKGVLVTVIAVIVFLILIVYIRRKKLK